MRVGDGPEEPLPTAARELVRDGLGDEAAAVALTPVDAVDQCRGKGDGDAFAGHLCLEYAGQYDHMNRLARRPNAYSALTPEQKLRWLHEAWRFTADFLGAAGLRQFQCGLRRDALAALDDLADGLGGTADDLGQVALRPAAGRELAAEDGPPFGPRPFGSFTRSL